MIGFEAAPAANPASCHVTAYELWFCSFPRDRGDGERCWEIARRTVSLGMMAEEV